MTSTLSVDAFDESTISIAPNPATEFINVTNSSNNSILNIVLTDLNGRIVKNIKVENENDNQINISDLSSGIYMMKIVSDKGTSTKKVIKE
jgi:LEA14-like dessication related protein